MSRRNPKVYKTFDGQNNIIVGSGELIAVTTDKGRGWITPHHQVIYNRKDAIAYATKLDSIIQYNRQRVARSKVRY